jgi:hypothetical protein
MVKFLYIEEYIQFIAGTRSLTNQVTAVWLTEPAVSLARYDKSVISSFAEQISVNNPFTDKQAELARRIVGNYRRQLQRLGVEVPEDITIVPFNMPLRVVDRTKRIYIKEGKLCMQFPYSTDLINPIKEFANDSEGTVTWNHDNKVWQFALTESCVNWACAFGTATSFDISPDVASMAASIVDCEKQPYCIELIKTSNGFTITNAPTAMVNYVEEHGGFGLGNELALLDMAAELGYTISHKLLAIAKHAEMLKLKCTHVSSETNDISVIVDYARTYHKFPIVSLNSTSTGANYLNNLNSQFQDDEIVYLSGPVRKSQNRTITKNTKLIHVDMKSIKAWQGAMPLVITYTSMTFGAIKSILLRDAGKICYYTAYDIKYNERS